MNSNIETLYHMFDSRVEAIEFVVKDEPGITNIPLMDLNLKDNLLVSCIYRKSGIIIPSGSESRWLTTFLKLMRLSFVITFAEETSLANRVRSIF